MKSVASLSLLLFASLTGCSNHVSTIRMGPPAPPRPLDCSLELIDNPMQGATQVGMMMPPDLELLGHVRVIHEAGRSPSDPEVLKLVKPEACKLGGEQVSVGISANFQAGLRTGSTLSYMVWRRKPATPATPSAPIKF
jgi:hypothetical protein